MLDQHRSCGDTNNEQIPRQAISSTRGERFLVTWRKWSSLSATDPRITISVPNHEICRQDSRQRLQADCTWISHPFSQARFVWEMIMLLTYTAGCFTIPFVTSFVVMDPTRVSEDNVNLCIYIICWLDIGINLSTGFWDEKRFEIVLEPKRILKNYAKGFLVVDLLSSLPYDRLTLPARTVSGPNSNAFVVFINLLPVLKILRFRSVCNYGQRLFKFLEYEDKTYDICYTVLVSMLVIHSFSCLCFIVPVVTMHIYKRNVENCECWIAQLQPDEYEYPSFFRHALFMAVNNLTASSFGYFPPMDQGHVLICIILMIVGVMFQGYLITLILKNISSGWSAEIKYLEIMNQLKAYTRHKQLPAPMTKRLNDYYYHKFSKKFFREEAITATLSERLKREIALHSCERFIDNVEIFKHLPCKVKASIAAALKMEIYLPKDVIVRAGAQGDSMFFLDRGIVTVLTPTGKEICQLEDGAYFGEVALLSPGQRRVATVVAIDVCHVFRLDRKDIRPYITLLNAHTEMYDRADGSYTQ